MGIKYLKIPCFLFILVSYSQALAEVANCTFVSITHCHDCAPVRVRCGLKQGYVNNIRLNHIKVEVMNLSTSIEVTYQLDSPPDRILQYRDAGAANQLNPWIRDEVSKRFEMNDVEFNESDLLIRVAEDGFGLDPAITLYRNPQREGGETISSAPEVPFTGTCEWVDLVPRLIAASGMRNLIVGRVICHSSYRKTVYRTTAVCLAKEGFSAPSAIECYKDQYVVVDLPKNSELVRYFDSESGSIIDPSKNPNK